MSKLETIRELPFSGKDSDYRMWSRQFLARAVKKGYKKILEGTEQVPAEDEDIPDDTDANKKKLLARQMNEEAYSDLLLSMKTEAAFNLVDEATTADLPNGSAKVAWDNLNKRYLPKDTATRAMLKEEFENDKLTDVTKDPGEWIAHLETIKSRLKNAGTTISDEDFLIKILSSLPEEYTTVADLLHKDLSDNKLDLAHLKAELDAKYKRFMKMRPAQPTEQALVAHNTKRQFKGRCHTCGRYGHKSAECKERKNNTDESNKQGGSTNSTTDTFKGYCNYCGNKGHKEVVCRIKARAEANRGKRNENVSSSKSERGEVALTAYALHATEESSKGQQTQLWLADTGASAHMIGNPDGMYNLRDSDPEDRVTFGNKKSIQVAKVGSWKGTVVQDDGTTCPVTLEEVKLVPGISSNLLSLTRAIDKGFDLTSTKDKLLKIQKGNMMITFDQRINTAEGYLLGVNIKPANKTTRSKLEDRGTKAIFVGYDQEHPADCYRFLTLNTRLIRHSRDYIWLNKLYGDKHNQPEIREEEKDNDSSSDSDDEEIPDRIPKNVEENDEENNSDTEASEAEAEEDENEQEIHQNTTTGRIVTPENLSKVERELRRLHTSYNPTAEQASVAFRSLIEDDENNSKLMWEVAFTSMDSGYDDPKTFEEAWNHPDPVEREKWREAIRKEFRDMIKRSVWRKCSKVPEDRKLIGCKWVFKKKKNGVYRARLCALGYSQVPGVDYTENHAPVINDVTFRIMLILWLLKGYDSDVIDVETAFLHGSLENEIYMKKPQGIEEFDPSYDKTEAVELLHSIYGLVQSARQWWKKFTAFLKSIGFKNSHIDPCLFYRKDKNGFVMFCIYVDDGMLIGEEKAIKTFKKEIESKFVIKNLGELTEYIGVNIKKTKDGSAQLTQMDIIKKLENTFGDEVESMMNYTTPMGPGQRVVRPTEEDPLIDKEAQTKYRSGVGMLLYLLKHSRPEISNAVRELAKVMDGALPAHYKDLKRAVKYVIDTKTKAFEMKVNKDKANTLEAYCDSDYGGDIDTRKSVTGYIVEYAGVPIAWKSRLQKSVALSSTEAEYYAISECVTEMMYCRNILEFLGIEIQLPMTLRVDNIGAIYLANNAFTGQRTKHIDARYHYVRNLIQAEPQILKIEFVKTNDNKSDIYTKNVSGPLFEKHIAGYLKDTKEGNDVTQREDVEE
jgi:hypothetical protein